MSFVSKKRSRPVVCLVAHQILIGCELGSPTFLPCFLTQGQEVLHDIFKVHNVLLQESYTRTDSGGVKDHTYKTSLCSPRYLNTCTLL